jgi:cystathionine beta-lyase family protein involved in aluminum resistance
LLVIVVVAVVGKGKFSFFFFFIKQSSSHGLSIVLRKFTFFITIKKNNFFNEFSSFTISLLKQIQLKLKQIKQKSAVVFENSYTTELNERLDPTECEF